jgi:Peptidase family M28
VHRRFPFVPCCLALVAACAPSRRAEAPVPTPTTPIAGQVVRTDPAITAADLQNRLSIFAADSMMGRETGTPGNVKGTNYIARELRRMGVEPAGENGTYFQTLPFTNWVLDTAAVPVIGGQPLRRWVDFLQIPHLPDEFPYYGMAATFAAAPVVYGGALGANTMLPPEQAAGKVVIFGPPSSVTNVIGELATIPHRYALAVAVAFPFLEFIPHDQLAFAVENRLMLGTDVPSGPVGLFISVDAAARMLGTPMGGATVGQGTGVLDGAARFVATAPEAPARNVVGVVRGSDSALAREYVALGAHNDHLGVADQPLDHDSLRVFNGIVRPHGEDDPRRPATAEERNRIQAILDTLRRRHFPRPDSVYNGADDDGSGSVSLLEIAEAAAKAATKPRRSLLFVWHVGEEEGLLGSSYFTEHPTVPRDSIVAQINVDMVGRGDADDIAGGGPGYLQVIGSRRLSTELGDLVERVNKDGGFGLTFDYQYDAPGHPQQYYCRSDHYMYARFGIPIAFFSTGDHRDYHQLTDEAEYIDYPKMARIANYLHDLAVTVANLDHRVVVDKPKPDPNAACVQ